MKKTFELSLGEAQSLASYAQKQIEIFTNDKNKYKCQLIRAMSLSDEKERNEEFIRIKDEHDSVQFGVNYWENIFHTLTN